jgi:hypothetical protein
VLETLAMPEAELVHAPPETEPVSEIDAPTHTEEAPEMVVAEPPLVTVKDAVVKVVPQALVRV